MTITQQHTIFVTMQSDFFSLATTESREGKNSEKKVQAETKTRQK